MNPSESEEPPQPGRHEFTATERKALSDPDVLYGFTHYDDLVAAMRRRRQAILEGSRWYSVRDIHMLQTPPPTDEQQPATRWKLEGRIFSVRHEVEELFAAYQFDAQAQPLAIVRDVLAVLGSSFDGWRLAEWFDTPNVLVGGGEVESASAPKDRLDRRALILEAARRAARGA